MTKKVFISYSHKDEDYRKELEEHLALLKRNNVISVWHDRKIPVGNDWDKEINSNLEEADIIIFLISSSFLASDYCNDVEVKTALRKNQQGTAKVVSIIVRSCDWESSDFSPLQGLPQDYKPINLWQNKDEAWANIIKSLKGIISDFKKPDSKAINILKENIALCENFLLWLNDTEVVFSHRRSNKIFLDDIYVIPDLFFSENRSSKKTKILSLDSTLDKNSYFLISGEEQQGKTSALKFLYKEFIKKEYLVIFIDAKNIKNADVEKLISKELNNQYKNINIDDFNSFYPKAILIDNIHLVGLNNKFKDNFFEEIGNRFESVIITCEPSFNYISSELPFLSKYKEASLLGFGNLKREEIVKKWVSLGIEQSISDIDLYTESDELKNQLDNVIKKNIVPSKPIYILIMLQMFEVYSNRSIEMTSYGHCYQHLIYQSFEKANIKGRDYDKYLNILTEISWAIFINRKGLNEDQIQLFFEDYGKKFLKVDNNEIINKLINHSILTDPIGIIDFKYPYIFYFFVGKKIAEGYVTSQEIRNEVIYLIENLHREDFSNILIFITHHTKDAWVLKEINEVLFELFKDESKASLTKNQLSFMDDFIKKIPNLVIEKREIQKERDKHNKKLDELEMRNNDEINTDKADLFYKINKTFRGMDIAGQIVKNRHATMTREALTSLVDSGISAGLRFLDFFIKISNSSKLEIIRIIEDCLIDHPNLSDREILEYAESLYLHLTYGVINALIKKIASSIGSKEATEIYESLENQEKTPAYILINQSIELQFERTLNINSVRATAEKLKNNPVCLRILKEMVVQHTYMYPVEYKKKQQLSALLDISVENQRLMDQKKLIKG